tara:strand:+ start:3359 stop:6019 length:2661 start_codon:yes stop_codon:yes gene_type:complete
LFLDIDCGLDKAEAEKGYATQDLGLKALADFITVTKMPKPLIINSGRGWHVYWVLDEALPPHEWQPLANALKDTFQVNGFFFDDVVTADSARVLRPIGTTNIKNGVEVSVLLDAPSYSKQTLQNVLGSTEPTPVTHVATHANTHALGTVLGKSQLSSDLEVYQYEPANPNTVYSKCKQVEWAVDNQDKVLEPMWYKLMGIAAFCENPEDTAKAWSKNHKDYDEAKTIKKVRQWRQQATGPATCVAIEAERKKGCADCPIKGNVNTPARCGTKFVEDVIDKKDVPEGADDKLPMPNNMKRANGGIVQSIDGTEIEVCPFNVYPMGYGLDSHLGYETVRYKWKRPHVGWQDLTFRQAHLNGESREFSTTIADQGIVLQSKKQIEGFQYMLRSYMDKLREKQSVTSIYNSMGWKENYSQFVIGERLYKRGTSGEITTESIALSVATGNVSKAMYTKAGTLDEWANGIAALDKMDMPHHLFALTSSIASPLWKLTGLNGIVQSLYGDTGAGKSIAQLMMLSVWGSPLDLYFTAESTQNAMFSRLGTFGNLPMTIDEATYMDNIGSFVFTVSEGKDKARLTRTATERIAKSWATPVTVSTNISWAMRLGSVGIESNAQLARLFEIEIPKHKLFRKNTKGGRTIVTFLKLNHGVVGEVMAKAYLKLGEVELKRRLDKCFDEFESLYGLQFDGEERFWETNLVVAHVGGEIGEAEGVVRYDFRATIQAQVDKIQSMRTAIIDQQLGTFDLVKEYINEVSSGHVTVMHTKDAATAFDAQRLPRSAVKVRFDVYRDGPMDKFDKGTVMLERKYFKEWLEARGFDWTKLKRDVKSSGGDATPSGGRCVLSKDTSLKAGQQYVVGVNLNLPEMRGFLDDAQQAVSELTLGQLGVVTP